MSYLEELQTANAALLEIVRIGDRHNELTERLIEQIGELSAELSYLRDIRGCLERIADKDFSR